LAQIGASLVAIAETPEAKTRLVEFLERYNTEAQESSETALVEQVAKELVTDQPVTVFKVADEANLRLGFEIDLNGRFVADGDAKPLTPKRVSSILRSLGYKTKHTRTGNVVFPKAPAP
jgi:hypothetical protein